MKIAILPDGPYGCRASKKRLFSPEECKKERASGRHREAFK